MMMYFIVLLFMSLGVSMVMVSQPLSMGFILLLISIFGSLFLSFILSSWFGYVLFLVYVGGLLVMFGYVVVLAPNVFFSGGVSLINFISVIFVLAVVVLLSVDFFGVVGDIESVSENLLSGVGSGLFFFHSIFLGVSLGVILLLALLGVVKICGFNQGSLRPYKMV